MNRELSKILSAHSNTRIARRVKGFDDKVSYDKLSIHY
jgi:hypothetical protein